MLRLSSSHHLGARSRVLLSLLLVGASFGSSACTEPNPLELRPLATCSVCAPGEVENGILLVTTDEELRSSILPNGGVVVSVDDTLAFFDPELRLDHTHHVASSVFGLAVRGDGALAIVQGGDAAITLLSPQGEQLRRIPIPHLNPLETTLAFAGDLLFVKGTVDVPIVVQSSAIGAGQYVVAFDADDGQVVSVLPPELVDIVWPTAVAPTGREFAFIATPVQVAQLGLTSPANEGGASALVRSTDAGTFELLAWLTSTSEVLFYDVDYATDGSIGFYAHAGGSAVTIDASSHPTTAGPELLGVLEPSGSLRWMQSFALGNPGPEDFRIEASADGVFLGGFSSVYGGTTQLLRMQSTGIAWRSTISSGSDRGGWLLGTGPDGGLRVAADLHDGSPDSADIDVPLIIDGVTRIESHGLALLRFEP